MAMCSTRSTTSTRCTPRKYGKCVRKTTLPFYGMVQAAINDFQLDVWRLCVSIYNHAISNNLGRPIAEASIMTFTSAYVATLQARSPAVISAAIMAVISAMIAATISAGISAKYGSAVVRWQ